jgi:D-xylose transport system substrate-binding protein
MRASSRFLTGVSFVLIVLTLAIAQAQKPEIKIGSSIEDMKDERWQTELDEFQQRAHELGGAVVTRSANGDDDLQFRQINELLKEGIDVLVFLPHDTSKAGRIVEAAHAKHVPVISYDRLASAPVDLYIGFDLFSVGLEQAQSLVDRAPKGNYLLLGGSPLDANSESRSRRPDESAAALHRSRRHPVSRRSLGARVERHRGLHHGHERIEQAQGCSPTAIVASNDASAGGAIQALEDKGAECWSRVRTQISPPSSASSMAPK